jgi:hypothetical protein
LKNKRFHVPSTAYLILCAFGVCASMQAAIAIAEEFPVNPSGYRVAEMREAPTIDFLPWVGWEVSVRWVDNERVLFGAYDKELRQQVERDGKQVSVGLPTLHVWNTRTGEVTRYWHGESLPFCVAGDFVSYSVRRDGQLAFRRGKFGEDEEFKPERKYKPDGTLLVHHFNRFTCKAHWFPDLLGPNKGYVTPLRDEDGTFEDNTMRIRGLEPPRRWLHKPDGTALDLPLHDRFIAGPWYSHYLGVYSLKRRDSVISRGMVNKAYLLFPDTGQVNALEIPGSQAWHSLLNLMPVTAGLVGKSSAINVRVEWDPGDAGLYLFSGPAVQTFLTRTAPQPQDGKAGSLHAERLSRGSVRDLDVSRNGCKVVMLIDPWDRENRKSYLRMVDFCAKQG